MLELLVQRDKEFQELMRTARRQGRTHEEMKKLEKEVEKRDGDIQLLQKQLKEAEHILVSILMGNQIFGHSVNTVYRLSISNNSYEGVYILW